MKIEIELNGTRRETTKEEITKLAFDGIISADTKLFVDGKESTCGKIQGIIFGSGRRQTAKSNTTIHKFYSSSNSAITNYLILSILLAWAVVITIMSDYAYRPRELYRGREYETPQYCIDRLKTIDSELKDLDNNIAIAESDRIMAETEALEEYNRTASLRAQDQYEKDNEAFKDRRLSENERKEKERKKKEDELAQRLLGPTEEERASELKRQKMEEIENRKIEAIEQKDLLVIEKTRLDSLLYEESYISPILSVLFIVCLAIAWLPLLFFLILYYFRERSMVVKTRNN